MANETLAELVGRKLRRVVQAMYEIGFDPALCARDMIFGEPASAAEAAQKDPVMPTVTARKSFDGELLRTYSE